MLHAYRPVLETLKGGGGGVTESATASATSSSHGGGGRVQRGGSGTAECGGGGGQGDLVPGVDNLRFARPRLDAPSVSRWFVRVQCTGGGGCGCRCCGRCWAVRLACRTVRYRRAFRILELFFVAFRVVYADRLHSMDLW